jgi:nitroreductase
MEKPAKTNFPVLELVRDRWSPRAFSDYLPSFEELGSLMEAARWAASCYNGQPWRFILARKDQKVLYKALFDCLKDKNKEWAYQAPVLGVLVVSKTFEHNGKPNPWSDFDCGLAMGQLTLQAEALDLKVHFMAGFHKDKARETFNIPEGFEPLVAFAIGKKGDPDTLPEELAEREKAPRERKNLKELVFGKEWGKPAEWLE